MRCEAIYCFDLGTVRFAVYPDGFDGPRILAEITEDALVSMSGACGDGESLVEACRMHFDLIEAAALAKHRQEPAQPVVLESADFVLPTVFATSSASL